MDGNACSDNLTVTYSQNVPTLIPTPSHTPVSTPIAEPASDGEQADGGGGGGCFVVTTQAQRQ